MRRTARRTAAFLTLVGVVIELGVLLAGGAGSTFSIVVALITVVTGAASWRLDPTV
jgi:uncharacterized protein (DUF58 family)